MSKSTNFKTAIALKESSVRQRDKILGQPPSDERTGALRAQLYNAACAYALWTDSSARNDFDRAMEFSDNLEAAADAWARRTA